MPFTICEYIIKTYTNLTSYLHVVTYLLTVLSHYTQGCMPNNHICEITKPRSMIEQASTRQLKFLGHILCMPKDKLATRLYDLYNQPHGRRGILCICLGVGCTTGTLKPLP